MDARRACCYIKDSDRVSLFLFIRFKYQGFAKYFVSKILASKHLQECFPVPSSIVWLIPKKVEIEIKEVKKGECLSLMRTCYFFLFYIFRKHRE